MQVIVEPFRQGKAVFGYSKRVSSGNPSVRSAVGTTWIRFRDQSELDHIRRHSAQIIRDFLEEAGFISIVTGASGGRAFTATAWETEDAIHRALDGAHSSAKHVFRTSDLPRGERITRFWDHSVFGIMMALLGCASPSRAGGSCRCSSSGLILRRQGLATLRS